MVTKDSGILQKAKNTLLRKSGLMMAGSALALMLMGAAPQANAQPVHFRYVGGHWSHGYHAGWHRYWGGPSIGFYYAPAPVYVVPGYDAPSYYAGPDFWYSNPSFGLSLNFGGGGYYSGPHYYRGTRYYGGSRYYHGGGYHGGGYHGGGYHGGGSFHGAPGNYHGGGDWHHR
jgi:hypothetical protein